MLLDSDNYRELKRQIDEENKRLSGIAREVQRKWHRDAMKRKVFPHTYCTLIESPKHTPLIISSVASNKRAFARNGLIFNVAYLVNTNCGYSALTSVERSDRVGNGYFIQKFTPHFFARYAKRAGINLTGKELIKHFFWCNNMFPTRKCKYKGETQRLILLDKGVGFVEEYDNLFKVKTFVTYEMLRQEQEELVEDLRAWCKDKDLFQTICIV